MHSYTFLLSLAIILLTTRLLGQLTHRLNMPQVVGALVAGIILGPAFLNMMPDTEFFRFSAELGVIILMFSAGLETDIVELKNAGKASFVIALFGALLPLAGGFGLAVLFYGGAAIGSTAFYHSLFIGVILTATSVSITVETLRELGKLDTRAGSAILGAALIDDIFGIVALTVMAGFADESVNIGFTLFKILLFFVFVAVAGVLFSKFFAVLITRYSQDLQRFAVIAFVFCLTMAYLAEVVFGVANITGAYFAGLIICNTQKTKYIASRFDTLSFLFLSPIFFASIGLDFALPPMSFNVILFSALLLVVAVLTKVAGCGFGAKVCGYNTDESLQIGTGMVSRGEVALIVASKGKMLGLVDLVFYAPIILVVVLTTILSPILLKIAVGRQKTPKYADLVESPLVDRYVETKQLDMAQQVLLEMNESYKAEKRERKAAKKPAPAKPGPDSPAPKKADEDAKN
jgi:Kef-type K+ transport system membrane component KefB